MKPGNHAITIAILILCAYGSCAVADSYTDTQQCLQFYYTNAYAKALPFCTRSSQAGNSQSQYVLGLMYLNGLGAKKNKSEALRWLQTAADQSYAAAHFKLDQLSDESTPRPSPSDKALRQLINTQKQAGSHSTPTTSMPPKPEPETPTVTQSDLNTSAQYIRETQATVSTPTVSTPKVSTDIAPEDTAPSRIITTIPPAATIPPPDDNALYQQYQAAAVSGDAHARFMLGLFYLEGRGVQKDAAQAGRWIKTAAHQGLADSQLTMGLLSYQGYAGRTPNIKNAMFWFIQAAKQGNPEAQYSLAQIYASGANGVKNIAEALKWWRKAASNGDARAQHNLAVMYLDGNAVEANRDQAIHWFIKEAEQGNPQTQFNLARLYSEGKWFKPKGSEAANWFYQAGESWLSEKQPDKAKKAIEKIKQLASKQHLTVPNLFLADVLTRKLAESAVH